jgi:hypothetical protein
MISGGVHPSAKVDPNRSCLPGPKTHHPHSCLMVRIPLYFILTDRLLEAAVGFDTISDKDNIRTEQVTRRIFTTIIHIILTI